MEKTITRVTYIFLIVGLAMLAGAFYWMTRIQTFIDRSETVPGQVIDLERSRSSDSTSYFPVIKYKTKSGQERTFRSNTGSSPPSYDVGEKVEVLYDVAEPSDARIRSFFSIWGGPAIVGLLGALFVLIGGGILYVRRAFAQRAEDLRRRGMPVQTDYQSVELNRSLQVNGRSPWCIVTQWKNPTTGELHLFRSANLWFDPTTHIQGRQITVYVDRKDPKRYHMDVSFLPKLAK